MSQYDQEFLKELDQNRNKIIYAKITALRRDESPLEYIEGRVTSGSINIDGNSAIRRSCSLSIVTEDINISNYIWTFNTKFKLEIGVENKINSLYPEIIWFNQGIYIITSFNTSLSPTAFTINIQGKDKMCQLNGENGGTFHSEIDFGKYEEINEAGQVTYIEQLIKDIIREMVHTYGHEPFHNIIIEDLEEFGLMLLEYRHDKPLYLLRNSKDNTGEYKMATLDGQLRCYTLIEDIKKYCSLEEIPVYDLLIDSFTSEKELPTEFYLESDIIKTPYCALKIQYGDIAGYKETDLTYTGDLIAKAGETVVSVLDKIKNMLGNFEYFYNLEGQFVFRKKRDYINTTWLPQILKGENSEEYAVESLAEASPNIYNFIGNELLTAFNNTPNIANLKNDYSVWGNRKSNGSNLPIHMRYAIDKKPQIYTSITVLDEELVEYNKKYKLNTTGQNSVTYISKECYYFTNNFESQEANYIIQIQGDYEYYNKILSFATDFYYDEKNKIITLTINDENINNGEVKICDWREIIYQMAQDYKKYNHLDDFNLKVMEANQKIYSNGITGYEQYYTDLDGFWRQLYNPETQYEKISLYDTNQLFEIQSYKKNEEYTPYEEIPNGAKVYYKKEKNREYVPYYERATIEIDDFGNKKYKDKDNIEIDSFSLYEKKVKFLKTDWNEIQDLIFIEKNNPEDLYSFEYIGYKKDIQNWFGEDFYQKAEDGTGEVYEVYDDIKFSDKIIYKLYKDTDIYTNKRYDNFVKISNLEDIDEDVEIYIRMPYYFYWFNNALTAENNTQEYYLLQQLLNEENYYQNRTYYEYLQDYIITTNRNFNNYGNFLENVINKNNNFTLLKDYCNIYNKTPLGQYGIYNFSPEAIDELIKYFKNICIDTDKDSHKSFIEDFQEFMKNNFYLFEEKINTIININFSPIMQFNEFEFQTQNLSISIMALYDFLIKVCNLYENGTQLSHFLFGPIAYFYNNNIVIDDDSNPSDLYSDIEIDKTFELLNELKDLSKSLNNYLKKIDDYFYNQSFIKRPIYGETEVKIEDIGSEKKYFYLEEQEYYKISDQYYLEGQKRHWNKNVYQAPNLLNFWFDFLDSTGEIQQFSVSAIGQKPKVANDNNVKSIYYSNAPYVIFYEGNKKGNLTGYEYLPVEEITGLSNKFIKIIKGNDGSPIAEGLAEIYFNYKNWEKQKTMILNALIQVKDKENLQKYEKTVYNILKDSPLKSKDKNNLIFLPRKSKKIDENSLIVEDSLKENFERIEEKIKPEKEEVTIGALGKSEYYITDPYDKKDYCYWRFEEFESSGKKIKAWRGYEEASVLNNLFSISSQGKTAKDAIDTLVYQHAYCVESVSITSIPIYYLEPNRRIYVYDEKTGIEGEYLLTKITVPLAYNGTMNLTATKAVSRIL